MIVIVRATVAIARVVATVVSVNPVVSTQEEVVVKVADDVVLVVITRLLLCCLLGATGMCLRPSFCRSLANVKSEWGSWARGVVALMLGVAGLVV